MATDDLQALFQTTIPHLRAYARSLTRNADAADDLVQDALLRAWAARSQFAPGTNFKAWMLTILRNRFVEQARRERGRSNAVADVISAQTVSLPSQDTLIHFDDVARAYWRLSPPHREILMLVGAMGLAYEDASKIVGCAVGTVRSRLSRARSELQETLNRGPGLMPRRRSEPGAAEFFSALAAA